MSASTSRPEVEIRSAGGGYTPDTTADRHLLAGEESALPAITVALESLPRDADVHGEAGFVKDLRALLRVEHGIPREDLSVSGYWRLGHDEDGWQSSKRAWNAQVEAEQETPPS